MTLMNRRRFAAGVAALSALATTAARAQEPTRSGR